MNSFKALMQKAEENKYGYEKQLKKINRQLEQDEKRKREENERIKKKEESFNQFKKIAKSVPSDFHRRDENRNDDRSDRSNSHKSSKDVYSINKKINEKNPIFNLKIKKAGDVDDIHNKNDNISKTKIEQKKKNSNFSTLQSKKYISFKDLMEKAKHNDISKPVVNNSSEDFREAKKALKNISGKKKYKDDYDDYDGEDDKYYQKKKLKKELHNNKTEIKKSKKELLNEQIEKRKREKERNLKAYDGSKDRVAQERMKLLKSRGIYHPVTTKISQEVTEMAKRLENRNNTINNSNNINGSINNQSRTVSKPNIFKSSSSPDLHSSKIKTNNSYNNKDSRKHSRDKNYESDDYDSEYEYERSRRLSNDNRKKVKKVKGKYEDYGENYVNDFLHKLHIYNNRHRYRDEEDIDDMEVGYSDIHREEARSLRIAKKEDLEEEELERQRLERLKKRRKRE